MYFKKIALLVKKIMGEKPTPDACEEQRCTGFRPITEETSRGELAGGIGRNYLTPKEQKQQADKMRRKVKPFFHN